MQSRLMYVELKSGYSDNGPAWIGKAFFSKTGQTIYFNGQAFTKYSGISGNYYEKETGDEYWISGVKKNGTDRHWAGSGKVQIDKGAAPEYLILLELSELPKNKYEIVELNNISINQLKQAVNESENEKSDTDKFDYRLRFKNLSDLSDTELEELRNYYEQQDFSLMYKKNRRSFKESLKNTELEIEKRNTNKQI